MPSFTSVWKVAKAALCFLRASDRLLAADRQVSGTESEPGSLPDTCDSAGGCEGEPPPDLERSFPHQFTGPAHYRAPPSHPYRCRNKATTSPLSSFVTLTSFTRVKN